PRRGRHPRRPGRRGAARAAARPDSAPGGRLRHRGAGPGAFRPARRRPAAGWSERERLIDNAGMMGRSSSILVPGSRRIPILFLALVLVSCVRHYPPAPVVAGAGSHRGAASRAAGGPVPGPHPDSIVVAAGQTLYGVSRQYGVPLRSLIDANNLQPPFRLRKGQLLTLPQIRTYTVRAGDTLYGVSRRFGVDVSTLAGTNHLSAPYPILVGQVLALPAPVQVAAAPAAPAPVTPAPVAPIGAPPPARAGASPPAAVEA